MISKTAQDVMTRVQSLLDAEAEAKRFGLRVVPEVTREEDDWIYVVVVPGSPGMRASDLVDVLDRVEKQVRSQEGRNVLIVPAAA